MHRGGTSALAGAVGALGVPFGRPEAMKPASPVNPLGFWEVTPLSHFNDALLIAVGGGWASPPLLGAGWHRDSELEPLRREGAALFAELHPTPQWAWKDPRNSVLLPFWIDALDVAPVLLISLRNPLEVAQSLGERDGMSKPVALALWERYVRCALSMARGRPTMVVSYEGLLVDPSPACRRVAAFLAGQGFRVEGDAQTAAGALHGELRHARFDATEVAQGLAVSDARRRLLSICAELEGAHDAFPSVDLPPETPETEVLLAARRDADVKLLRAQARLREQWHREQELRRKLAAGRSRNQALAAKLERQREKLREERQDRR